MKKKTETYRLGSKEQYKGIIERHIEKVKIGSARFDEIIQNVDNGWNLESMIPDLAEMHFGSCLEELNLPSKFVEKEWTRRPPSNRERRKPAIYSFERFRRYVTWRAKKNKLNAQELERVRLLLDGLHELWSAHCRAAGGDFEGAAVRIGRAMPIASLIMVSKMEHQWHNGKSYQQGNKGKARRDKKPLLKAIYIRLAKRAGEPRDLWSEFVTALRDETWHDQTAAFDDVKASEPSNRGMKHWYVTYRDETKNRNETVSYETFRTTLGRQRRKLKT